MSKRDKASVVFSLNDIFHYLDISAVARVVDRLYFDQKYEPAECVLKYNHVQDSNIASDDWPEIIKKMF